MIDNTISLCMIVKNEEKNLKRCLDSVSSIVDEIIIVDTGSKDKTIEIAKEYNAKIFHYEWNNDFSEARNISLENATKNWILFLDADEEMEEKESTKLKNILQLNSHLEAFHLRLVNIITNINVGDAIVLRVFKNKPEYRFVGKMHEQIVTSIESKNGNACIGATDVKINHYGYDPQLADIKQKQKRNLELLNSYPESKKDGYYYYSLGNEYARINDFDKALEIYNKALEIPLKKGEKPVYLAYLYLHIAKVLASSKRFMDEINNLHEFQKSYKNFKDLYFMESLAYMECSKYYEAKLALDKYSSCTDVSYEYPCSSFEKSYDINHVYQNLENGIVEHEDKLISALILCYEDDPTLINTVKSLNEVCDEIIISTPKTSNLDRKPLENIGATIIDVKSDDKKNVFMRGYQKCKCKFILLVKPKECFSIDGQKDIVNTLQNTSSDYLNLTILNSKNNMTSKEFRVFRNSKTLSKFKNFDDFASYIHSNNIEDSKTCLYKV